ncbi:MAG: 2'-5' RNA ligase family protein, partial [Gaiellales bacterium]
APPARAAREGGAELGADDGARPQEPRTGHITLFYAPLRSRRAAPELADRARAAARACTPFDLVCAGFDEFASADRPVAWLGVTQGSQHLGDLRAALCACDEDCHRHAFVPHLTLAYGEDPAAYGGVRDALAELAGGVRIETRVDELWIAGFPQSGHPARDLRYVERLPLGTG